MTIYWQVLFALLTYRYGYTVMRWSLSSIVQMICLLLTKINDGFYFSGYGFSYRKKNKEIVHLIAELFCNPRWKSTDKRTFNL